MTTTLMIDAVDIHKRFGDVEVLRGVDLAVPTGSIVAMLGPNGAGKTTMINILTTLIDADRGTATINGFDVARHRDEVRRCISLTGQHVTVDDFLTGAENLTMMARLAHLPGPVVRTRTAELIEQFDLGEFASRRVATYSGGVRRRLDLAIGLIARPPLIFLDEPTTGLDPRSRLALWAVVRELAAEGVTILLTTQYLEEADQLADSIAVIDDGRIIAEGTASELKSLVGGERVELGFVDEVAFERACDVLGSLGVPSVSELSIALTTDSTTHAIKQAIDLLGAHPRPIEIGSIEIVRPSLDDVFLALTDRVGSEVAA